MFIKIRNLRLNLNNVSEYWLINATPHTNAAIGYMLIGDDNDQRISCSSQEEAEKTIALIDEKVGVKNGNSDL